MNALLRAPVSTDFEALVSWVPDNSACARWAGPQLRFPFVVEELPALLMTDRIHSFSMVTSDNVLAGFGQFWPRGEKVVHLGRIIVAPHKRRTGLGLALCKLLIAEALHATNAERITLRVYRDNAAAFSIYTKLGFSGVEAESNSDVLAMEVNATSYGIDRE
jgi:RimJ/RimL family protein N-acetyltransferase